ncbi:MAG: hypothetical protein METHP_01399 [Methanoregula sp. SKADARSKE-2]|nr:MAG: hypothetical protein METHP_01399 [Methanoregula sp. SKADARSKE-2]
MDPDRRKSVSLLIIPGMIALIVILFYLNERTVFEPPFLLAILNTVFLGLIPLFIASIAYQSYRTNGSENVLLLGAGMLIFGLGSIAAGWLNNLPSGANITATLHNSSVCIGSIFSLAAVILVLTGPQRESRRHSASVPLFLYGGIVASVILFSLVTVQGLVPPFLIQGHGPTDVRQVILSNATVLYALTSLLFFSVYIQKRDAFFFWFGLSLALIAIGLAAHLIQPSVGSLLGWAGRIAQYLGACVAFVAFLAVHQRASKDGIPLQDEISDLFSTGETTRAILSASTESIWLLDLHGTILLGNPIAFKQLGKSEEEVVGRSFEEWLNSELAKGRREIFEKIVQSRTSTQFEDEWDGIVFQHTYYPVFDRSGRVTGVVSFSRDITEQKRAENAVRVASRRTEMILESISDSFIAFDKDWHISYINQKAAGYGEKNPGDVMGKVLWEVFPAITGTPLETFYRGAMASRQMLTYTNSSAIASGKEFELRSYPMEDGIAVFGQDVTDRKRAEEALKASEKEFREIAEAMPHIVWATRPDGWNIYFNQNWMDYTGLTLDESYGHGWSIPFHPDDRQRAWDAWQNALHRNGTYSLEARLRAADGSYRRWLVHGVPVYGKGGAIAKWIGTCTDIEEMKQAQDALAESEARYRELLEKANSFIVKMDREGKITYFNEYAEKFFGYTSEEILGQSVTILIPPVESYTGRDLWKMMDGVIRAPDDYELNINENVLKNGNRVWVSWRNRGIRDAQGNFTGPLAVGQDITGRIQMEAALVRKNEDLNAAYEEISATHEELQSTVEALNRHERGLKQALKEKDILLSEIHHRVKNNLTAFISLLSLDGSYEESPAGVMLRNDLQNRARSMALIHETLYKTNTYADVDMGVYLRSLVDQIAVLYPAGGPVKTIVEADGTLLDIARATPCGLIINELITNSLKYAFPPSFDCEKVRGATSTIAVRLAKEGDAYALTIEDNGIGIPDDLDITSTKTLGLKLVSFLSRHQLQAKIEIDRSGGTRFILRFRDESKLPRD